MASVSFSDSLRELLLIGSVCSHGNAGRSISASGGHTAGPASYWSMLTGKVLIYQYFCKENTRIPVKTTLYFLKLLSTFELNPTFVLLAGSSVIELPSTTDNVLNTHKRRIIQAQSVLAGILANIQSVYLYSALKTQGGCMGCPLCEGF